MSRFISTIALCLSCSLIVLANIQETKGDCEPLSDEDPCMNYVCDPSRGWIPSPKCDDGLHCTEDICSPEGECFHKKVNCSNEIFLPPCFTSGCKEAIHHYSCFLKPKLCDNSAHVCVDDECVEKESLTNKHWAVEITFNESFTLFADDIQKMLWTIEDSYPYDELRFNATVEMNEDKQCTGIILLVDNEEAANDIRDKLNGIKTSGECYRSIICEFNSTRILEKKEESSHSSSRTTASSSTASVASSSTKASVASVDVGEHNAKTCIVTLFVAVLIAIENFI